MFDRVPGHTCVKRLNYQLADAFNFESDFEHAETVIFSCGVNDLARYGQTAYSLADIVCPRLVSCCKRYKNTNFVFSSLTFTRDRWLNDEIDRFNLILRDLARDIPNLAFFDAHGLVSQLRAFTVWEREDRHGIHLCFDVMRAVARGLVNCVGKLAGSYLRHHKNYEWLYYAPTGFNQHLSRALF